MSMNPFTLVIDDGPLKGRHYPVTAAGLKLGRASQCDIAINDLLLSRSHCRFELRGEELWVIDLASANETLVNEKAVDERRLSPGDLVKVGQTILRVEQAEAAAPVPPAEGSAGSSDVVIDLGFGKEDSPTTHARKQFLRPALWTLAAVLILILGTTLILDPANRAKETPSAKPQAIAPEKSLLIYYEKIEASTANIFRYELSLSPGGVLTVKIDDLSGKNRHVRKEKTLDPERLAELSNDIESSGIFSLDKSYTGFAAKPNTLNEWTLTVAIGKKAHTCRVTNRLEPENFKALREKLETFSKNELGIWAIQFSADKLTALARDALEVARKKFDEREVKYGNVFEAIRSYQEAVFYLDTVNPKPDFYAAVIDGFESAESELGKRYEEQRFRADRAINLSDWPAAARELKILCELIPDRADSRHKEATRKLIDVESRLKKNRR
ncbi:MAG TPA: FHA domain-containing protein [Kiritimatiellia bacterium]|nr:FHA domain-containing protein [Kiritimatiellia bacterium]HPS07090.1 FHA domain-containing protein [Kiritimatiellia bacterium]